METIKNYLVLVLTIIIIVLLLFKSCNNPLPNLNQEPTTIYKSDTVFSTDTLIKFKSIIKPKHDTIYKIDSIDNIDLDTLFYVREYNDSLADSNITIYSKTKVIGILDKLDISYKNKKHPILITNNITTIKTEYKPNKLQIYSGLSLGGNKTSFLVSPFINVNVNKLTIQGSYELINKSYNVGVGWKIFNSKK